ncbi:long-chain fatty acid--CoA ligase [Planococcus sp. ANT_H30]|uniref:AMP-binding protein n=1 Tax=Planococcus sp. ANT_H30 TaxID=2597347 RepID=UPI0011EF0587|nr:AMP-binding protein [Planococcus sp. ANT_H30]KAA0956923.1 long-chain fatty acid--CoA ligase [Planococcus sp. ANT_H30]
MNVQLSKKNNYDLDFPEILDIPNVSAGAILKGSVKQYGEKNAYIYRDTPISYNAIYQEAKRFANALRTLGIGRGMVVSTHLPTCPQYVAAYYGIILSGAAYSPLNPYLPAGDLTHQLNDSETQVVVTHESVAHSIREVLTNTQVKHVILTGESEIYSNETPVLMDDYDGWYSFAALKAAASEDDFDAGIVPELDLAHIAYTGGTTGSPKGVMITHANLVSNITQIAAWTAGALPILDSDGALRFVAVEQDREIYKKKYLIPLGEEVRLSPSPLFHITGGIGMIVSPMAQGVTTLLPDRFVPTQFLDLIEKYSVSSINGAPAMWNILLNLPGVDSYDFSTIRNISSGAAPLSQKELGLLKEMFPNARVGEGYGLTEATASVAGSVMVAGGVHKVGTVGLPTYNTKIKVVSLDGMSEDPLPTGQAGEICIYGPQVMKGYFNKPEETAATLRSGWLHTGDIGIIDEDGYLAIVDRKKEMLIYNGYNVYPSRIEEVLVSHPDVQNAIVIGKPVEGIGEIPKAFVILKPGSGLSEEELMTYTNERVVHYSKVRELEFLEQFPMTAAGKISKIHLKKQELEKH